MFMSTEDRLVVLSGTRKGTEIPITGAVSIGRQVNNTLQIEDPKISRKHAQVVKKDDGVYIKDLGSGNGTYIGTQRIIEYRLVNGDIIRIGRQQIQFLEGLKSDKKTTSSGTSRPASELVVHEEITSKFESEKAEQIYRTFFEAPAAAASDDELLDIQKRLQAVYAANQSIASEHSLDKVFDKIMGQIFSLICAHNGLIMLKRDDNKELSVEYVRCATPGEQIHVSMSIIRRAYENSEAIITSNAAEDSRFRDGLSIINENISSAMCVPLVHQEENLGAIYVDNHGTTNAFTNSDLEMLVALAAPAATAIKNAQYLKMVEQAYQDTLVALANAIELRDHYTVGHTWRVTNFAIEVARELGWGDKKLEEVYMGGVLHDVGKIAVDNAVLGKPGKLSEEEFAQIKVHPERGADLLRDIKFLHPLIPYCLYHHERWDGDGYPFGISGESIPIEGRLIAVSDAFDAMTSTRPYREGMDPEAAIKQLEDGKEKQFDPIIVDALVLCYQKGNIARILQDYHKNEARSIACPFCSTFIRFDENVADGSKINCNVCHKTIRVVKKEDTYLGVLMPPSGATLIMEGVSQSD